MKRFILLIAVLLMGILFTAAVCAEEPPVQNLSDADAEELPSENEEELLAEDETIPFSDETDEEWGIDEEYTGTDYEEGDFLYDEEDSLVYPDEQEPGQELFESSGTAEAVQLMPNADPGSSVFSRELSKEEAANARVTIGADLTAAQRRVIYADFGIEQGSVSELVVTNTEERAYLSGLVSEKQIGRVSLSSAYIQKLPEGSGLTINLHNINYITSDIYRNALITAGVTDAYVVISAPYPVSGTGALVGIYKAYEDITGDRISEQIKQLSAEELVVTSELSEAIGGMEAADLIAQLKQILAETKNMSDDAVRSRIESLAEAHGFKLKKKQVTRILKLVRKLETMDEERMSEELADLVETAQKASGVAGFVGDVLGDVQGFFDDVGDFMDELFE